MCKHEVVCEEKGGRHQAGVQALAGKGLAPHMGGGVLKQVPGETPLSLLPSCTSGDSDDSGEVTAPHVWRARRPGSALLLLPSGTFFLTRGMCLFSYEAGKQASSPSSS